MLTIDFDCGFVKVLEPGRKTISAAFDYTCIFRKRDCLLSLVQTAIDELDAILAETHEVDIPIEDRTKQDLPLDQFEKSQAAEASDNAWHFTAEKSVFPNVGERIKVCWPLDNQ